MSSSTSKTHLRKYLRRQRNAMSAAQVQKNSQAIVHKILLSTLWQKAQHIGLYLPIHHEVDLTDLLNTDKTCYLPSIQGHNMQFHQYHKQLELQTTAYGLRQPAYNDRHPRVAMDLCFLPLVGFDDMGRRLGMGGGFYDRYFADNTETCLWGVAHATQRHEALPDDPWDVKLHGIITEQDWILI